MKTIAVLLMLAAHCSLAQIHVWTQQEADQEKFHVDLLPVTYEEKSEDQVMDLVQQALNARISKEVNPGIMVFTQILIGAEGKVDYIIFDLKTRGHNLDSLNQLLKKSFVQHAQSWKASTKPAKPFRFMMMTSFGRQITERQVRKVDSAVVDIKSALAYTDTSGIKKIFFHQLDLQNVPEVIYRFPNAEELYLSGNKLTRVTINLKRLPRLKQLFLDGNLLTNDSLILTENKTLQLLNIRENKFTDIPKASRQCRGLYSLWLGGNKLSGLSNRSFRKLKQVRDLNFYKSDIAVLPKGIKKMKNLEVLDLYYNRLETLPASLIKLKQLKELAISYNQLHVLPKGMGRLQQVHTLYAHHNKLSALPEGVARMQKINILDLGYNVFTAFPVEIASLDSLHELDISYNNLAEFPERLLGMKKLDKLYLRGNPFVGKDIEKKYANQLGLLKGRNVEVFY
jgi:Leucine-rich repeat (LRR) protein